MNALRLYTDIALRLWPLLAVPVLAWLLVDALDRWLR